MARLNSTTLIKPYMTPVVGLCERHRLSIGGKWQVRAMPIARILSLCALVASPNYG
ncbi:hypothetical protein PCI56_12475 [Plesiomonas shigelloides subsp. oncorhynchi]|nr:hypothetical protein [Plesiomonas shigelloides]